MMKKLLALFLALLMVFSLLPVSALADDALIEADPAEALEEALPAEEPAEEALPEEPAEEPEETPAEEPSAPAELVLPEESAEPEEAPAEAPAEDLPAEEPEEAPAELPGDITLQAVPGPGDNILTSEYIPDEAFRDALFAVFGKRTATADEAEKITVLNLSGKGITDLTGIEFFKNISTLDVSGNFLTSLDVSCPALVELFCYGNALTSLNASGCAALQFLECSYNALTSLDVSGCTALRNLVCSDNAITSLDVSGCCFLTNFDFTGNPLASLKMSGCSSLLELHCSNYALTELDASGCTALTYLDCARNFLTSLKVSGCTALTYLNCSDNALTGLDASGCTELTYLLCNDNALASLKVSGCTALKYLECGYNALPSLDVSTCTALLSLSCGSNALTSLDLSACPALTGLVCFGNKLTALDVSGCPALKDLNCVYNALTSLNVSGTDLYSLRCSGNALTALDLSGCVDLSYLDCYLNALTELKVSGCTRLRELNCTQNALTSLKVSGCPNLAKLDCGANAITEMDLSVCPALTYLFCNDNALASLDLSVCPTLTELDCSDNALTELDVSVCPTLTELDCSDNALTSLKVSGCDLLRTLECGGNQLMDLDLTGLPELWYCDLGTQYPAEPVAAALLRPVQFPAEETLSLAVLENPSSGMLDIFDTEPGWFVQPGTSVIINYEGTPDHCDYRIYCENYNGTYEEMLISRPVEYVDTVLRVDPAYIVMEFGHEPVKLRAEMKDPQADPTAIQNLMERGTLSLEFTACDADDPEECTVVELVELDEETFTVAPKASGTAWVDVSLNWDGTVLQTCRVRVDVVNEAPADAVVKATLPVNTATVELFSTDYTELDVLLDLRRWYDDENKDSSLLGFLPPDDEDIPNPAGVTVTYAEFADKAMKEMFILVPVSDRRLAIVPNPDFVNEVYGFGTPVPKKLSSQIKITLSDGTPVTTEQALTITLKTSRPKLKAAAVKFNSLLAEEKALSITGGEVLAAEVISCPDWAEFDMDEKGLTLRYTGAAGAKLSGTATLDCTVKGWAVTVPVTVKLSASAVKPKLTFPVKSVTFVAGSNDSRNLSYAVTPADFLADFELVSVVDVKTKKTVSYADENVPSAIVFRFDEETGEPTPRVNFFAPECTADGKTHSYKYTFSAGSATAAVTVKVLPETTPLKLTVKTAGAVDLSVPGSFATFTPAMKNLNRQPDGSYRCYLRINKVLGEKKGAEPIDGWDYFNISPDEYDEFAGTYNFVPLRVTAGTESIPAGCTWYAYVDATDHFGNVTYASAKVKIPVKVSDPAKVQPSVTAKTSGKLDLLRGNGLKLTVSTKNLCGWTNGDVQFKFYKTYDGATGKAETQLLKSRLFSFVRTADNTPGSFEGRFLYASAIHPKDKYAVEVTVSNSNGSATSKLINLPITVGKAALKLTPAKATMLLGDPYAETAVAVTFADPYLRGIARVELAAASAQLFDLAVNPDGSYALHWKNNVCPTTLKSGKTVAVKLNVWMQGNELGKPLTLTLKVTVR